MMPRSPSPAQPQPAYNTSGNQAYVALAASEKWPILWAQTEEPVEKGLLLIPIC